MGVLTPFENEVTQDRAKPITRNSDKTLRTTAKPTTTDLLTASTISSASYGNIMWVELDGESQVSFTMKVVGTEDASGNTGAATADFAWFYAYGTAAPALTTNEGAIRVHTWSAANPGIPVNDNDYQLTCIANGYDNGARVFTADAKRIGIAVKEAAGSVTDPVVSIAAFKS